MADIRPVSTDRADVDLYFDVGGGDAVDASGICTQFKFRAMMNGGYLIYGKLKDANFSVVRKLLIDAEYFKKSRSQIFRCQFRIKWSGSDNQTTYQSAYIISMRGLIDTADSADLEFVAIDPPSWYLNTGDCFNGAFKGKVSQVIEQVISRYAPDIVVNVSETADSQHNYHYMMGMDPKTFITSLIDWSSSLTNKRTQWIIAMDDTYMQIQEQAELPSKNVGFYVGPHAGRDAPTIRQTELLANNALSATNTKIITNGISAVSGQYLDVTSDFDESRVVVKDSNTSNKYKAKVGPDRAFTKPGDGGPPTTGYTQIQSIPELSGGELGIPYEQYIDGRARSLWLNMTNMVMRCRFRVIGHGVFSSGIGLGVDTITVQWLDAEFEPYFLSGNWIVYGFEHIYALSNWVTDIYCARFDYDAAAKAVP